MVGGRLWFGSGVSRVKALIPVTMKSDAVMPLVIITRMGRCDGLRTGGCTNGRIMAQFLSAQMHGGAVHR